MVKRYKTDKSFDDFMMSLYPLKGDDSWREQLQQEQLESSQVMNKVLSFNLSGGLKEITRIRWIRTWTGSCSTEFPNCSCVNTSQCRRGYQAKRGRESQKARGKAEGGRTVCTRKQKIRRRE